MISIPLIENIFTHTAIEFWETTEIQLRAHFAPIIFFLKFSFFCSVKLKKAIFAQVYQILERNFEIVYVWKNISKFLPNLL